MRKESKNVVAFIIALTCLPSPSLSLAGHCETPSAKTIRKEILCNDGRETFEIRDAIPMNYLDELIRDGVKVQIFANSIQVSPSALNFIYSFGFFAFGSNHSYAKSVKDFDSFEILFPSLSELAALSLCPGET